MKPPFDGSGRTALALLPLVALAAASLAWGSYHAFTKSADLGLRLEEVRLVRAHVDPYQDPDATYPPSAMPPFTLVLGPMAERPALARAVVWLANLAALGYVVFGLVDLAGGGWPRWLVAAFAATATATKPVRLTLGMGQFSLLPLAAMLAAERDTRRGRPDRAGLWLAIALMKPTMSLPLVVLLAVRGHLRTLVVAAALGIGSWLGLAAWVRTPPLTLLQHWVGRARMQDAAGSIDLPSILARIDPAWSAHAPLISLAILALASVLLGRYGRRGGLAAATFAAYTAAVFSYHRPYDLVLLLPALAQECDAAIRGRRTSGFWWPRLALPMVLACALVVPSHPRVIPEALYDAVFLPLAYVYLGIAVYRLGNGPEPVRSEATPPAS